MQVWQVAKRLELPPPVLVAFMSERGIQKPDGMSFITREEAATVEAEWQRYLAGGGDRSTYIETTLMAQARKEISQRVEAIRPEHLVRQTSVAEQEESHKQPDSRSGADAIPFGLMNHRWRALKELMGPADELWEFSSSEESWKALSGKAGIALVRNGTVIASFVTVTN